MTTTQPPIPTVYKGISPAGVTFLGVAIAVCVLSGASVALRIFSRLKEFRTLHKDDITIIIAWVTCLAIAILTSVWVAQCGVGWSITEIPPTQLETFFKVSCHSAPGLAQASSTQASSAYHAFSAVLRLRTTLCPLCVYSQDIDPVPL